MDLRVHKTVFQQHKWEKRKRDTETETSTAGEKVRIVTNKCRRDFGPIIGKIIRKVIWFKPKRLGKIKCKPKRK